MADQWESKCRQMARTTLGEGVGHCLDVGYNREQVLAYAATLCDLITKTKERVSTGAKSISEAIEIGMQEAAAADIDLSDVGKPVKHPVQGLPLGTVNVATEYDRDFRPNDKKRG